MSARNWMAPMLVNGREAATEGVRFTLKTRFVVLIVGGALEDWVRFASALDGAGSVAGVVTCAGSAEDLAHHCERFRRVTGIGAQVVRPGTALKPHMMHFVPSSANVVLRGERFVQGVTANSAMDALFCSLARDYGENSLAALLEDPARGVFGLEDLKASGALVLRSTKAPSVDRSHVFEVADRSLALEELAAEIIALARQAYSSDAPRWESDEDLDDAIVLLRARTGRDISSYDRSFLRSRLRRRMKLHRGRTSADYCRLLDENDAERLSLIRDLRLNHTRFFKQPKLWSRLSDLVIPQLVANASNEPLRFWVPDCSTGEDAYALAIVMHEAIAAAGKDVRFQIFATDAEADAIRIARGAAYGSMRLGEVSPERLTRFFFTPDESPGSHRLVKRVRDAVAFAVREVSNGPDFSKLDLILSGDLFEHLSPESRSERATLFHHALARQGMLVADGPDALTEPSSLFSRTDTAGIYRARNVPKRLPAAFRANPRSTHEEPLSEEQPDLSIRERIEQVIVRDHAPPVVIVNAALQVTYFYGHTGRYLQPSPGLPSIKILDLCPIELRAELRFLFETAFKARQVVSCQGMRVSCGDLAKTLCITVHPFQNDRDETDLLVIFEEDGTQDTPPPPSEIRQRGAAIEELETTLRQTRDDFQSIVDASVCVQDDLRASNKELLVTNAGLKSTNLELEIAQMELQAINDELQGLNAQISRRLRELGKAHAGIRHLFESTRVPTLFLDSQLRLRMFTPAARELFNLIDADIGRPIADVTRQFEAPTFETEALEVMRSRIPKEREVDSVTGSRYLMRIFPHESFEDRHLGVVATFSDVTAPAMLAELGRRALDEDNLGAFLQTGLELVKKATGADLCDVLKLDDDKTALDRIAAIGLKDGVRRVEPFAAPNEREPMILGLESTTWPEHLRTAGARAGARVVIWGRDQQPFGLLGVYSLGPREFSHQDLIFLKTTAEVFGSAIQRKAVEEARLRENHLEAVQRSEARLRRAERLASIGDFAVGIARELNDPLSNIALSAEYATETKDAARRAKLLDNVVNDAERCGRIVDGVLRFARNEVTRKWPTEIAPTIRHSVKLVKAFAGADRLSVVLDLPDPSLKIIGNPTEVEQVFTNLFRNAVEAHPGHCTVNVRACEVDAVLRVWVSDDGPGIPPEACDRIFDPFFSTKRKSGRTGLGLSITHRIVTGHGGSVRVVAGAGPGATFELEFPREGLVTPEAVAEGP